MKKIGGEQKPININQDHGKGGLSLRGVAVMTETAMAAETAKTVKTAKTVMKAAPLELNPPPFP